MKREQFVKLMQRSARAVKPNKYIAEALEHPDVIQIIERHEKAVADRKLQRLKRHRQETS